MVREGKITAEDGVRLLEAVNRPAPSQQRRPEDRSDWSDDPIGRVVAQVMEQVQDKGWGGLVGSWGGWSAGPLGGLDRRRQRETDGWEFVQLSEDDHGTFELPEGAALSVENEGRGVYAGATDGPARVDLEGDDLRNYGVYVARKGRDVVVAAHRTEHNARLPRLRVSVPRTVASVGVRTSGGGAQAQGFACPVTLKTSGGGITVEGQGEGAVEASTAGGGIKVEGTPRSVSLKTAGGGIRFSGRTEAVEAKTSGGSIDLQGVRLTSGDHQIKTSGGSIRLGLAPDSSVAIAARTSAGSVRVDLPGAQGSQSGSRISPRYTGTFNGEGARLDVATAGGSVDVGLVSGAPTPASKPASEPASAGTAGG
jgi:hypothetical protein